MNRIGIVPDSEVDTRETESSDKDAYNDCLKALWLAPDEHGRSLYLGLLTDAPGFSTLPELRLLVALVQRVAIRRKWVSL